MSLYLQKRKSTYYFRIRVPSDLQQYFSGGEIRRSLKTTSRHSARVAALGHQHEVDRLFAYIRSGVLTEKQIAGLIARSESVGAKPVAAKPSSTLPPRKPKADKLSDLVSKYVEEHMVQGKWKEKTHQEVTSALDLAVSILGDVPAKTIDRSVMVDYLGKLKRLPVNMRKSGKPVKRLLEQENKRTISQRTINKYITRISSLFIWCVRQGYLDRNPAEGLSWIESGLLDILGLPQRPSLAPARGRQYCPLAQEVDGRFKMKHREGGGGAPGGVTLGGCGWIRPGSVRVRGSLRGGMVRCEW